MWRTANSKRTIIVDTDSNRHVHEALATRHVAEMLRGVRQGLESRLAPQSLSTVAGRGATTEHTIITHMSRRRSIREVLAACLVAEMERGMLQGLEDHSALQSLGAVARRATAKHTIVTHMPRRQHIHEALAVCLAVQRLQGMRQGLEGQKPSVVGRRATARHTIVTHMPRRQHVHEALAVHLAAKGPRGMRLEGRPAREQPRRAVCCCRGASGGS